MKLGFTIIEFIVSMAIASLILLTLLSSFFNINSVLRIATDIVDMDTRLSIAQNQLEKDISGAYVPVQINPSEAKDAKDKIKPLTDIFMSKNKDGQLSTITFISNNPLRIYDQKRTEKPRIARIVYRVIADENKKDSFNLMRQEGEELNFATYDPKTTKFKSVELASSLKKITVEYKIAKPPAKDQKEKTTEFETFKEWPPEVKEKEKKPTLPQFVIFDLTFWDDEQKEERSLSLGIEIPAWSMTFTKAADQAPAGPTRPPTAAEQKMVAELKNLVKTLMQTGTQKV